MQQHWTVEQLTELAAGYRQACILAASADLGVFDELKDTSLTAGELAGKIRADVRGVEILADALAAMNLVKKQAGKYSIDKDIADLLTANAPGSILPGILHQANCLRRWAQLARVVKEGRPAERISSIRGAEADVASFIGAMDNFSAPVAAEVLAALSPLCFRHLLDVGGASGTWTIALLKAVPETKATLFDLPEVLPMARRRLEEAGLADRVTLVGGDFYTNDLSPGADLVWLGAIAHQNSRSQNRMLFAKINASMAKNGMLVIRDVVMEPARTEPEAGALFAVNMLVATDGGGTYTFAEYKEDLASAGFGQIDLLRRDPGMNSLIKAVKN